MSPLLPPETLRKLANIRRINVAAALVGGLALAAAMLDHPRITAAALVLTLLLNLTTTETLRVTITNLKGLKG